MADSRATPPSVVFHDPKTERGGGQVVLEDLLDRLSGDPDVRLVMPAEGQAKVRIPPSVTAYAGWAELTADPSLAPRVILVSNANSGMPALLRAATQLAGSGRQVTTVAIVHNYPLNLRTSLATRYFLKRFDEVVVVEPGLAALRPDARIPSWLSLNQPLTRSADYADAPIRRTNRIKSYGRPDRMKGLDLLPAIFAPLSELGYVCEVAIGSGFMGDEHYLGRLRADLSPWLVEGARDSSWIQPGDIFVIPSRYGEAACLLAQEVLSRGAFAVAGRVGLMPYLSPDARAMRTFAVDDTAAALEEIREVLTLPADRFADECLAGVALIEERAGRWHEQLIDLLRRTAAAAEEAR